MSNKIAYYFESIEGLAGSDDLTGLIDLHKRSFEQNGWEVVALDERDARQHPLYATFNDSNSIFATSRNGWQYTRACYMRWLAYASAGHFFADFDIVNYNFSQQNAHEMREMAGGPTFLSGAGAIGLFRDHEYDQVLNAFLKYRDNPFIDGMLKIDVNDMNILLQCRPDLFSLIQIEDTRIARDYSCPGWDIADLVHYPYHYTKPPRSATVNSERPVPNN